MTHGRIMVIEDDEELRLCLVELLRESGYDVESCAGATEALERLRVGPLPDAMVVDMVMPGLSGVDLVRRCADDPALSRVPTVLITGLPAWARNPTPPQVAVLEKPFSPEDLIAHLGRGEH